MPVPGEQWLIEKNQTLLAYFFKPFMMPALFNIPAGKLANNVVDLAEWDAHKTNAFKMQLAYSKTSGEKLEAIDKLLLHQAQRQQKQCEIIRRSTDTILIDSGTEVLPGILRDLKLNERTFQRIFKKFVGVTPTQYRRICQFEASFEQLKNGQFEKLTDIAYQTGFADQSHFIRSFREYTQITPKDYLKSGLKKR